MGQAVKVRRADIDRIAEEFDSAPEDEPEEVNRKEAIRILEPKIKAMRRKGYTWRRIGELLTKGGIPIEPHLLASYLRSGVGKRRGGGAAKHTLANRAGASVARQDPGMTVDPVATRSDESGVGAGSEQASDPSESMSASPVRQPRRAMASPEPGGQRRPTGQGTKGGET
jgi:hypothetical protein